MIRNRFHIRIQLFRKIDVSWGFGEYQIAGAKSDSNGFK
jgi:hypothetical protein